MELRRLQKFPGHRVPMEIPEATEELPLAMNSQRIPKALATWTARATSL